MNATILDEIVEELRQHPRLVIADDYEISVQRLVTQSRDFRNGEQVRDSADDRLWIALRILHRRRPGRAVTEFRSREALGRLVDSAFESALRSSVDPWFRFPIWKPQRGALSQVAPKQLPAYDTLHPKLNIVPELFEESYEASDVQTLLHRKTERFQLRHERQAHAAHFAMLNRAGKDFFWVREDRAAGHALDEREDWLEALLMQSVALTEGRPFDSAGTQLLMISPAVGAALLKRMAPWFHADYVQSGRSPLVTRRDKPLFSGAVNIVDNGNYPGAPNAAPFDMEGTLTQETPLVTQGILRGLLYDTYAATRENRLSTGNYLRPPGSPLPRIATSQIYFSPSTYRPADLCRAMGEGFILQSIDNLEPLPGSESEFSLLGSGWRVSGGQCVESVRGITLTFDIFEFFSRAVEIGNDLAFYGSCGAPSILLENIPIGLE